MHVLDKLLLFIYDTKNVLYFSRLENTIILYWLSFFPFFFYTLSYSLNHIKCARARGYT